MYGKRGGVRLRKIINPADGMEVASFFMSWYINVLGFSPQVFVRLMEKESDEVRDNFTYLAFSWIHRLAKVRDFDDRNENSVFMARDICLHVPDMPKLYEIPYEGETSMDVDTTKDQQVVHMIASYLAADSKDSYQDFLLYALNEHRTLQQTLTRLFQTWLEHITKPKEAQTASTYLIKHVLPEI